MHAGGIFFNESFIGPSLVHYNIVSLIWCYYVLLGQLLLFSLCLGLRSFGRSYCSSLLLTVRVLLVLLLLLGFYSVTSYLYYL